MIAKAQPVGSWLNPRRQYVNMDLLTSNSEMYKLSGEWDEMSISETKLTVWTPMCVRHALGQILEGFQSLRPRC